MRYLKIKLLCLAACSILSAAPIAKAESKDQYPGILFHASFDGTRKAEIAGGCDVPSRLKHASFAKSMMEGIFIDGKFGKAITGRNTFGWYWALGNFSPERGTVAFFINKKGFPYGFEPFSVMTVDPFYWYRYIMLKSPKGNTSFSSRFARESGLLFLYPADPKNNEFTDGKWHHVAISWDQAYGANIYLDGKLYASKWGNTSWLTKGIDPDYFSIPNSDNAAYDELYVFDRALNATQIRKLADKNQPPTPSELEPLIFDELRKTNRLRELSWENTDEILLKAKLGTDENTVAQVIPKAARSARQSYFAVLDGKLGTAWPYTYGYEYSKGLHVEIDKPYDYMQIEGGFKGKVYVGTNLLEEENSAALLNIVKSGFMYRKSFKGGKAPEALSFFRGKTEESKSDGKDLEKIQDETDEIPTFGRISELSFFKTGESKINTGTVRKFHLGKLSATAGAEALKCEFSGRFSNWDRNAFTATPDPEKNASSESLKGLFYYHILLPAPKDKTVLDGIRLSLWLSGAVNGNAMRIEMRDPTIPARRCTAMDFILSGAEGDASKLSVTLDTPDTMLFPDTYVWLTICFRDDLQVLTGPERDSSVELLTTDIDRNVREYVDREINFVKSRFTELSEARDWVSTVNPEKELPQYNPRLKELFIPLVRIRESVPDDSRANAIWNWTHKSIVDETPVKPLSVPGCENAPEWALLQRELLNGCRNIYYWWIANRQVPNGEFGNDLSDDSDFVQDFVKPAMFSDPEGRFAKAITMVADTCYQKRLKKGINKVTTDYLHAYEEGLNAQVAAAIANYGNPKYMERLMEASRTVRDSLTGMDGKGRRRFKANTYGADEVRDAGETGVDIPSNALMLHPVLLLTYYSKNPAAFALLKEWCAGWRSYCEEAKKAGRKDVPVATKMDGTVVRYDRKLGGFGVHDAFAALYDVAKIPEYRDTAIFQDNPEIPTIRDLALYDMIDKEKHKSSLIAQAKQIDLTHPTTDHFGWNAAKRYLAYELAGDEKAAIQALEACIRNLRMLYEAYTWAEPWNDRIWVPDNPAIMMALGEIPHERNQTWPRHYVSYEGLNDFAAWVTEKSEARLKILFYNFTDKEQKGKVKVWRNVAGSYSIILSSLENSKAEKLQDFKANLQRASGFPITLPPRKLCSLELNLEKKTDYDILAGSDLAVSEDDVTKAPAGITVKVHNLGNMAAEKIRIRLLDSSNRTVEEKTVDRIDAPLDLNPRAASVNFTKTPPRPFKIIIDPDNSIPEIYEFNNEIELK